MKTYVSAKIHGLRVTDKAVSYHGSVAICPDAMGRVGIAPYEQVHVVNLTNGQRWVTYAIPATTHGAFSLNGGGARLGEVGDSCVVMTYAITDAYHPASVIHLNADNEITDAFAYEVS